MYGGCQDKSAHSVSRGQEEKEKLKEWVPTHLQVLVQNSKEAKICSFKPSLPVCRKTIIRPGGQNIFNKLIHNFL